jgi:hypothetical protein
LTEAVLLGQPQRRDQILKKNDLVRRLSLETPQMNMKMMEVTAAVLIAKKNILKRSRRMDGSDAGVVRNGHTKTALAGLRRLWIISCVAFVESLIKLILKHNCVYPIVPDDASGFASTLGQKRILHASRF